MIHTRDVENIFAVLSKFGGLASSIVAFLTIIGSYVNTRLFMGHIITKIFAVKEKCNHRYEFQTNLERSAHEYRNYKSIKFSLKDKFSHLKEFVYRFLCCKCNKNKSTYLTSNEIIYQKGYSHVNKELDMIEIVNTIHQLKAGLAAVIQNDEQLLKSSY